MWWEFYAFGVWNPGSLRRKSTAHGLVHEFRFMFSGRWFRVDNITRLRKVTDEQV